MKSSGGKLPYLLVGLGLSLLAALVFVLSLWLLFPYKDVERRLEAEFAKRGIDAEITGLGPRTPLSYRIKNIHLTRALERPLDLNLKDTVVGLSPSDILSGRVGVSVTTGLFGGTVSADLIVPKPESVTAAWQGIDLAPIAETFWENGYPVTGKADGKATITLPFEGISRLDGDVEATLADLSIGPIKVVGLAFDPVSFGSGKARVEARKGKLRVFDTALSGGDLGVTLDGAIAPGPTLGRSPLEAKVDLRPSQKAERDLLIPLTLISSYKNRDGSYTLMLKGTPSSPLLQPR